jgi:hypothetical protein
MGRPVVEASEPEDGWKGLYTRMFRVKGFIDGKGKPSSSEGEGFFY